MLERREAAYLMGMVLAGLVLGWFAARPGDLLGYRAVPVTIPADAVFRSFDLPLPTAMPVDHEYAAPLRVAPTASPKPAKVARPKAVPTATHTSSGSGTRTRPKLAGGPFKPWRTFNANVQAARDWLQAQLSRTSWRCIDVLFDRESRWRVHAGNRFSGAYGIPQALPGSKMAWAGDDWRDNATTQVRWGLHYIRGRYGNPCIALDHAYRWGWY
jgi:hypothetical protein